MSPDEVRMFCVCVSLECLGLSLFLFYLHYKRLFVNRVFDLKRRLKKHEYEEKTKQFHLKMKQFKTRFKHLNQQMKQCSQMISQINARAYKIRKMSSQLTKKM